LIEHHLFTKRRTRLHRCSDGRDLYVRSHQPDYATRAIACVHDLDGWAVKFRERWKPKGVNFGVTRIGAHAGPVLVGNFGGSRFFDYTAYGDTINTAARLEAANKFLCTRTCVSASRHT
jgi:adenylate cyclase